jgi:two-component system, NarL family, invasion response regulator UvrY
MCVDDMADVATVIRLIIEAEVKMECVGCLPSADDLVDELRRVGGADVVLMDATMPGKDPFEAMSQLRDEFPKTRTIVYSGHSDQSFMDRSMDAGAWGCVSKNDPPQTIIEAVRQVAAGRTFFPRLLHAVRKTA